MDVARIFVKTKINSLVNRVSNVNIERWSVCNQDCRSNEWFLKKLKFQSQRSGR